MFRFDASAALKLRRVWPMHAVTSKWYFLEPYYFIGELPACYQPGNFEHIGWSSARLLSALLILCSVNTHERI